MGVRWPYTELKAQSNCLKTAILSYLKYLFTDLKVAAANRRQLNAASNTAFRTDTVLNSYWHGLVTLKNYNTQSSEKIINKMAINFNNKSFLCTDWVCVVFCVFFFKIPHAANCSPLVDGSHWGNKQSLLILQEEKKCQKNT